MRPLKDVLPEPDYHTVFLCIDVSTVVNCLSICDWAVCASPDWNVLCYWMSWELHWFISMKHCDTLYFGLNQISFKTRFETKINSEDKVMLEFGFEISLKPVISSVRLGFLPVPKSPKIRVFIFHLFSWKVLKLDIDDEKVLIFVSCGPEKPNHPSNISVMLFPWSFN